jgi:alkanesulfonate monooxygenase SsuD/methylene tetrahydromethanopterin reductase-like flavin-dependent oxidoreductase (luciferase family)
MRAGEVSFGVKTTPIGVSYQEIRRAWQEADEIPEIEHAWLWDHFQPLRGDLRQPVLDGWTLLTALAAATSRLEIGILVTNNLVRPPAVLAKMAATVDTIAAGRLIFGVGAGGSLSDESRAFGLGEPPVTERIERLAEACTIIRALWTDQDPVTFSGRHYSVADANCWPKPAAHPHPPILIGGVGETRLLRVVAQHADVWNMPGPPYFTPDEFQRKSRVLDDHCAAIGRDTTRIIRSVQLNVAVDGDAKARDDAKRLIDVGAQHIVLAVAPPYEKGTMRKVATTVIAPMLDVR